MLVTSVSRRARPENTRRCRSGRRWAKLSGATVVAGLVVRLTRRPADREVDAAESGRAGRRETRLVAGAALLVDDVGDVHQRSWPFAVGLGAARLGDGVHVDDDLTGDRV